MKTKLIFAAILISFSGIIQAQVQICTHHMQIGGLTPTGEWGKRFYFGPPEDNYDHVFIARYNVERDITELRVNVGDDLKDKFVVGNENWEVPGIYNQYFVVTTNGKVGINSPNPAYELDVNGVIRTKEVIVTNTGWADFVFKKGYRLRPLSEVASHIEQHSSLPEMPTECDVEANGVNLAKLNVKLLQKVEELTLYIIEQEARISELENKMK